MTFTGTDEVVPLTSVRCPACSGAAVADEGPLPALPAGVFGGRHFGDVDIESGHLMRCAGCDLRFRCPRKSQADLTRLYERLPPTVWECKDRKAYWPQALRLMEIYSPNRTVMDVGCFRGEFLAWLPRQWRKIGIEPNAAAREIARAQGVLLHGYSADDMAMPAEPPGVITMFDVLEHTADPMGVLERAQRVLAAGGSIIVLTGAADSWPWRMFGRHYWYSSLPEHVSFFTLRWFRWAAARLGLSIPWFRYLASEPAPVGAGAISGVKLGLYVVYRSLIEAGLAEKGLAALPVFGKVARWPSPPWWPQARDHILIVLSAGPTTGVAGPGPGS